MTFKEECSVADCSKVHSSRTGKCSEHRVRPHGTKSKYDRDGCRCDLCKSAKSEATKAYHARKKERLGIVSYTECVDCGTETRPMTNPEVRCRPCNFKATMRDRRIALKSAESERIIRAEVMKRSNGVCPLCNEIINFDLAFPDPKSPSIDHIIPVSKGGGHLYANLRVAHLECNMRRGNRIEKEEVSA